MRIGLGVSGGIAAYKTPELVRLFQDRGLDVQVIMTAAARNFVTSLTLASLSGHKVISDMFGGEGQEPDLASAIEHIRVAQEIDALVIAPATANVIAKMAHGIADDFLTTLILASKVPVIVAPAMNVNMWENAATRQNIERLRELGYHIIEPDEGYLACGMTGAGRMADVPAIARTVFEILKLRDDLRGETLLVTAGPTEEPLDPVRYLTNRSSGKMGYALAEAGRRRGAKVILVSGPTRLETPTGVGVTVDAVHTTDEMADAAFSHLDQASVVLMAAAVVDFAPVEVQSEKIKKQPGALTVTFKPTQDILAEVARRRQPHQIVVGFAAETGQVIENAAAKLREKHLDLMVANDVTAPGAGFDYDTNIVTLVFPDGKVKPFEKMSKLEAANRVLDAVVELRSKLTPAAGG